jgi:APA family basic amino acid/polyamine antiporter
MARDGVFFRAAARVHPRFHTPWVAIIAQAVWSGLLVLTNAPGQLAEYTGFAVLLFSGFAVSAVFVLRWRCPNEPRPFRAWGYPIAPALFALTSLAITVSAIKGRPGPSMWGLLIMAAGIPIYWLMSRRAVSSSPASVTAASVPSAAANTRNDPGE